MSNFEYSSACYLHRFGTLSFLGLLSLYQGQELLVAQLAVEQFLTVSFGILCFVNKPLDLHLQSGAVSQGLSQLNKLLLLLRRQFAGAGRELDDTEILPASHHGGEEGKGRGGCLDQQVFKNLPNKTPDTELRVIGATGDRQIEVYLALAVLEQSHCQANRQIGGLVAFYFLAEGKLVDENLVLGSELFLVDQVLKVEEQLAFVHRVAKVGAGVRGYRREIDIPEGNLEIDKQIITQRVELAGNLHWRVIFQVPPQIHVGKL